MALTSDEADPSEASQQAIEWLVRLRSDNLSEDETHAFADWLSQDVRYAEAFAEAEDLFDNLTVAATTPRNLPLPKPIADPKMSNKAITGTDKVSRASDTPTIPDRRQTPALKKSWLAFPLGLAAAWLVAVGLVLPEQAHLLDAYLSDYHTGTGEQRTILLTDGSRILLNTHTAVSVDYQQSIRQIILHHGQARFTVAKDSQRPFEVAGGGLAIKALGTVFEVYKQESNEISVTVQEHAVEVRLQPDNRAALDNPDKSITVEKGQQFLYAGNGILNSPLPVNLDQSGAWQQGKIFLNDRPLSELIAELDRYRQGRIFLSDAKLKNLRVVGVFNAANPDAVLNKVCTILGLKETRLGPWWVVLGRY